MAHLHKIVKQFAIVCAAFDRVRHIALLIMRYKSKSVLSGPNTAERAWVIVPERRGHFTLRRSHHANLRETRPEKRKQHLDAVYSIVKKTGIARIKCASAPNYIGGEQLSVLRLSLPGVRDSWVVPQCRAGEQRSVVLNSQGNYLLRLLYRAGKWLIDKRRYSGFKMMARQRSR